MQNSEIKRSIFTFITTSTTVTLSFSAFDLVKSLKSTSVANASF